MDDDYLPSSQELRLIQEVEQQKNLLLYPRFSVDRFQTPVVTLPVESIINFLEENLKKDIHKKMDDPLYVDEIVQIKVKIKMNPHLFFCISKKKEKCTIIYPELFSKAFWEKVTRTSILQILKIECSLSGNNSIFIVHYKDKQCDVFY